MVVSLENNPVLKKG